ncbi:hypothetical protein HDF16_004478 [Granulicella aggregans]|uniref:DUF3592 domain-containing protein n=1 Tax=Granulicella aggregans TaxID=474949 RepID=A0A7W8E5X0_9BACT|nr:hypothetical protein [Granulicella aggregans]MBB5059749.1 hypothetical protein [Granulicella aggregans]
MSTNSNDSMWLLEKLYSAVVPICTLGIIFFAFAFRKWKRTPGDDWCVVEGRVQQAKVIEGKGRDLGKYGVIAYSYFVNEYQSGEYTRSFLREDSATHFVSALKDKKIQVHYNPKNPAIPNLKEDKLERLVLADKDT